MRTPELRPAAVVSLLLRPCRMARSARDASWLRLVPHSRAHRSASASDLRIAEALYRAQVTDLAAAGRTSGPEAPGRPRTLEQIVAMKPAQFGWTQAFKQLKAERLIAEQTLGEVMARWGRTSGPLPRRSGSALPGA